MNRQLDAMFITDDNGALVKFAQIGRMDILRLVSWTIASPRLAGTWNRASQEL